MRIFYLTNNRLGLEVLRYLKSSGQTLVGLAVHPREKRRLGDEIIDTAGLDDDRVFDGSRLRDTEVVEQVRSLEADIAVSVLFGFILRGPFIKLFPSGVINLHPALLPYNRGAYPNVWSIIDRTPAGVTLHYIDEQVDTGDIIAQQEVPVSPADTGKTLYDKLEQAALTLFKRAWPDVREGRVKRRAQPSGGTVHRVRDVETIDRIDLDKPYVAKDLIDVIRARTFPPYRGAYFEQGGHRYYVRLEISQQEPAEGRP